MSKHIVATKSLIKATFFDKAADLACQQGRRCPVVTISRSYGSNAEKISHLLADQLTVKLFDDTLLDAIVQRSQSSKHLMHLLDEKFTRTLDDWTLSLVTAGKISRDLYLQSLIKAVTAISQTGGVIIGRGAHLILSKDTSVFRVRLEGSLEHCVRRVAIRHGVEPKTAEKIIYQTDRERIRFVRAIYRLFPHSRAYYDLVINTDYLEPLDVVDIIIYAMEKRGLYVPGVEK